MLLLWTSGLQNKSNDRKGLMHQREALEVEWTIVASVHLIILTEYYETFYYWFILLCAETTTITSAPTTSVNLSTTLSTNTSSNATTTATTTDATTDATTSTTSFMSSTPKEIPTTEPEKYVHLSTGRVAAATHKDKRELDSSSLKTLAITISTAVVFFVLCAVGCLVYYRLVTPSDIV